MGAAWEVPCPGGGAAVLQWDCQSPGSRARAIDDVEGFGERAFFCAVDRLPIFFRDTRSRFIYFTMAFSFIQISSIWLHLESSSVSWFSFADPVNVFALFYPLER